MAHRDFAAHRSANNKKNKGSNKNLLIGIALAVVFAFGGGLYFLKSKTDEKVIQPVVVQAEKNTPKSVLPNRPEEVWSYIKALETRTVPVDDKPASVEKNMRLTEEQRQVLMQMEKEQKAAELQAKKQAEAAKQQAEIKVQEQAAVAVTPAPKKQEPVKKPEPVKQETAKKAEPTKTENAKKTEPAKQVEATASSGKKFGLQCGAFKNQAQAENLQARLVMTGLNAFIAKNGEWYRVRIGAFADRAAAAQAQSKAKSVEDCVVIGM